MTDPGAARRASAHAIGQADRLAGVSARQVARAPGKAGDAPVVPLMLMGIGGYLLWYGVHYFARPGWPTDPVKAALQGRPIPERSGHMTAAYVLDHETDSVNPGEQAALAASAAAAGGGAANSAALAGAAAGGTTGNAIADDAQRYAGAGYVWGGNASTPGHWDCSSFVSYVLGHDLGLTLPGGRKWGAAGYPPHAHGPTTLDYMLYGTGVSHAAPGDLIVSVDHIGICIGPGKMISAQDVALGTGVGNFPAGFPGGTPLYRRVAVGGLATGTTQAPGTSTAGGRG